MIHIFKTYQYKYDKRERFMSQPYIDVTEFINDESSLTEVGNFWYDEGKYGILKPISSKYNIQYLGDASLFNASSKFAISSLITIPENGVRKTALIDDILVILDNNGTPFFYKIDVNMRGDYLDYDAIMAEFGEGIVNGSFLDVVTPPNQGGRSAIFIKDNQEVIFHNISTPSNITTLINNRLVKSAAINTEKHFCLVFETGELLYYNGNGLSNNSYKLIPQDIIDNEDYNNFDTSNKRSPNEITKATSVGAYDGFAITTFDGNVIVWGSTFQDLNDGVGSQLKPEASFNNTSIAGIGKNYGVSYRDDGTVNAWGVNDNSRLTGLPDNIKYVICLPSNIFYSTNDDNGKEIYLSGSIDSADPTLSGLGSYYDINDVVSISYASAVSYHESGYFFATSHHENRNLDLVKFDFKMKKHNERYYIPILDFVDYEPANFEIEVYEKVKCNYTSIGESVEFSIVDTYYNSEGIADFSKVVITPIDKDQNGVPDNPLSYNLIINDDSFIILESFIDLNGLEATRISKNTKLMSRSSFILPDNIYYADIDKMITDSGGNVVEYTMGNFYKGNSGDVIPNNGHLLENAYDEDSGVQYLIRKGRSFTTEEPFKFQWTHYSSDGADRIDPSISTIMDMYVLTNTYDNAVRRWLRNGGVLSEYPKPPTSEEIRNNIRFIERNKSTSDQVIYIPAEYKLLFGVNARPEHQAEFKIIKMNGATLTDNEIKSRTIDAINEYFDIDNWDFGESFYFTELAAHIHNRLSGHVASVVVVPKFQSSTFGDLFQIKCEPNELFLSTATVNDVVITNQYTNQNLRKFR